MCVGQTGVAHDDGPQPVEQLFLRAVRGWLRGKMHGLHDFGVERYRFMDPFRSVRNDHRHAEFLSIVLTQRRSVSDTARTAEAVAASFMKRDGHVQATNGPRFGSG